MSARKRVVDLRGRLSEPVSWPGLRHDRERLIFVEAFWQGVSFGLEQAANGYFLRQQLARLIGQEAARRA